MKQTSFPISFLRRNSLAGNAQGSSGVSFPSGCAAAARRARFPARMLLRLICLSGGGPPRGCPRTMMAHPERTILTMPRCTVGTAGPPEPLLCAEAMCGAGKTQSGAAGRTGSVRVGVGAGERLQRQGAGGRQATVSGLDRSARRTLEQQRDWEQKRRDLRRRHTFYSPRKRARAPPPSGQLASRTR